MIEFTYPTALILLLLVPVLGYVLRHRPVAALRFPTIGWFTDLHPRPLSWLPTLRWLTRLLIVFCLIIALSGPRTPDRRTRIPTNSIAVMIVLDLSPTMFIADYSWTPGTKMSRSEAAQRAFQLFVQGGDAPDGTHFDGRSTERGTDAIGLVTFTNWPQPVCPPTLNHSVLLRILEGIKRPAKEDDASNIGDAIVEGLIRLEKTASPQKVLILISDGQYEPPTYNTEERKPFTPQEAAAYAANLGIKIHVIDPAGEPDPNDAKALKDREDGRYLNQQVAEMTGGRYFPANDGTQLLQVCKEIDQLERQPVLSQQYRRYYLWYPYFLGTALLLTLGLFALEHLVMRRIP